MSRKCFDDWSILMLVSHSVKHFAAGWRRNSRGQLMSCADVERADAAVGELSVLFLLPLGLSLLLSLLKMVTWRVMISIKQSFDVYCVCSFFKLILNCCWFVFTHWKYFWWFLFAEYHSKNHSIVYFISCFLFCLHASLLSQFQFRMYSKNEHS